MKTYGLKGEMTLCEVVSQARRLLSLTSRPTMYTLGDVILAIMKLAQEGPMGRRLLSRYLKLGERSTRNLLSRMHKEGLISRDPIAGAFLNPVIERSLRDKSPSPAFCHQDRSYVICIHHAKRVPTLSEVLVLRDALVRSGCYDTIIAYIGRDGVEVPGLPRTYPGYQAIVRDILSIVHRCEECKMSTTLLIILYKAPTFNIAKSGFGVVLEHVCDFNYIE